MSGMPGGLGGLSNPCSGGFNNPYLGMASSGIPGATGGCAPGDPNCQNLMQKSGGWAPPGMGYGAGGWYGAASRATPGQPLTNPNNQPTGGGGVGPWPASAPYNPPTILNQAFPTNVGPYY